MKIELEHPFVRECKNPIRDLLTNLRSGEPICLFSTYYNKLANIGNKISAIPPNQPNDHYIISGVSETEVVGEDGKKHKRRRDAGALFKGNGMELLAEVILKTQACNPYLGVGDYHPLTKSVLDDAMDDVGVDGIGVGHNGKPATVQVKYRPYDYTLHGNHPDHLHNFVSASWDQYNVDPNDHNNMLIITSGDQVFYKEMMNKWDNKVRFLAYSKSWGCIPGSQKPCSIFSLKELLGNNFIFWQHFHQLMEEARA